MPTSCRRPSPRPIEDPDFVQAATDLSEIIDREVVSLVTKTPYSP